MRRTPPWIVLLLLKWTVTVGKLNDLDKRPLTKGAFVDLINLLHDMDGDVRLPTEHEHHRLFLRRIAFQQFWLQRAQITSQMIARPSLLFGGLEPNHRFRTVFRDSTGIEIESFFLLAFGMAAHFVNYPTASTLPNGWLDPFRKTLGADIVDRFLRSMSAGFDDLRSYLLDLRPAPGHDPREWYEVTPLTRYPLLRLDGQYRCCWLPVLYRSVYSFVHDRLRESDPARFMKPFGAMFGQYVRRVADPLDIEYVPENELQALMPGDTKVVDGLLPESDGNVLVEAKAGRMTMEGRTGYNFDQVYKGSKPTAFKSLLQGQTVAARLRTRSIGGGSRIDPESTYLLVVTYEETYLGTGADVVRGSMERRLERHVRMPVEQLPIPLEHIFFISIDDYERLLTTSWTHGASVTAILRQIVVRQREPESMTFVMGQHLAQCYPDIGQHPLIRDELERLAEQSRSNVQ